MGDARAQYDLGLMYYRGDGLAQDMNEARRWLGEAAKQGQRDAQVLMKLRGLRLNQGVEFKLGNATKLPPLPPLPPPPPLPPMKREPAPQPHHSYGVPEPDDEPPPTPADRYARVAQVADRIEAELRRLNWWSDAPPTPQQLDFREAFAMDTMPFAMWIQFVLLPRVRGIVVERGEFPSQSMVGAHAVREYDGQLAAADLTMLLSAFDEVVTGAA